MRLLFLLISLCLCVHLHTTCVDALYVYVGSSLTAPGGIGIYKQNTDGTLAFAYTVAVDTPWFIAVHPNGKVLYVSGNGVYLSYNILSNGNLTLLNSQPCGGQNPTHVSVHPSGEYLFGANYDDGTFVTFYLAKTDGRILSRSDLKKPGTGTLTIADRQEGPHAHMITPVPYNDTQVVGVDLGADKLFVFVLDKVSGRLGVNGVPYGQVASGAGSRHIAFHPTDKFAYVVSEMGNAVYTYAYDPARGSFNNIQVISTIPPTYTSETYAAEIRVHPNGQYVYATNRGHDSVVSYSISKSGKLTVLGWISSYGYYPRGMNIDPSGKYLYVASTESLVSYSIDQNNGGLKLLDVIKTPNVVDVEFGLF